MVLVTPVLAEELPVKLSEMGKIDHRLLLINGGGAGFCFHTLICHLDLAEIW